MFDRMREGKACEINEKEMKTAKGEKNRKNESKKKSQNGRQKDIEDRTTEKQKINYNKHTYKIKK